MSFTADATLLQPGSIVKISKPQSSAGTATSAHFFIVLPVPNVIRPGNLIPLVGISSRIDPQAVDPAKHVAMKWLNRPEGDPETGFSKPCHAYMDFTHVLEVYSGEDFPLQVAAEHHGKFIRAATLHTVVAAMNAWNRRR